MIWYKVCFPIAPTDPLPAERKTVLVWLDGHALPFCGYVRYAAGELDSPYFVVYHGNDKIGANVVAWCDCLPSYGPDWLDTRTYNRSQPAGRGYCARPATSPTY